MSNLDKLVLPLPEGVPRSSWRESMMELATSAAAETAGLLLLLKIFEDGRPPVGPGATAA